MDIVVPDWFTFTGDSLNINETIDKDFLSYLKTQNPMIFPRISNVDINGVWTGSTFADYIHTAKNRQALSLLILETLQKYQLRGINLDFESLDVKGKDDYLQFLLTLSELLHKNDLYLSVDVPTYDEAFDYEAIGQIADMVVVMAYDEHFAGGTNGPIASKDWFENAVSDTLQRIPKEKAIIALGQYSYDWNTTKKTAAKSMGFDDTLVLANQVGADVETDKTAVNTHFAYKDSNNDLHDVLAFGRSVTVESNANNKNPTCLWLCIMANGFRRSDYLEFH